MLYFYPIDPSANTPRLVESLTWPSAIEPSVVEAYLSTRFVSERCGLNFSIREAPLLCDLLPNRPESTAAILTAFNPRSETTHAVETNRAANAKLRANLEHLGLDPWDVDGRDPDGAWPPEPSFLALGLSKSDALFLGKKFGQNAIVWFEAAKAPPTLLLLR